MKKENCLQCKNLPEGESVRGHDHRVAIIESNSSNYTIFIKKGLGVGFTDEQIDFLSEYILD